jgi:hypothetical protein
MSKSKTQNAVGIGNIQIGGCVKGDVILQIIDGVHSLNDIDGAIKQSQKHLESLQRRKGLIDCRIILAIVASICICISILLRDLRSIPLMLFSMVTIYIGSYVNIFISRIENEIAATNSVIIALYKQILFQRLK